MTFRHVVLTVAAVAVLGLGIFLFLEVRATPETAPPAERVASRHPDPRPSEPAEAEPSAAPSARNAPQPVPTAPPGHAVSVQPSQTSSSQAPPSQVPPEDLQRVDALMAEANKAYDRGDFDEAKQMATRVLASDPTNVRMLRIMVSSWCIDGDVAEAQNHYLLLPPPDRQVMKSRCARYGISFTE